MPLRFSFQPGPLDLPGASVDRAGAQPGQRGEPHTLRGTEPARIVLSTLHPPVAGHPINLGLPLPAAGASLAVIGAGVAGCALAAGLRRGGWQGPIHLWERGRGPGGRAATRRSRGDADLRIDHGAPLLNIVNAPDPDLLAPLLAGGWLLPWRDPLAVLAEDRSLQPPQADPLLRGALYRGRGGMEALSRGLLALAETSGPPGRLRTSYGTLVRHLEPLPQGGWRLLDASGAVLGEPDWLVLSGSLLAHPRAMHLSGWPEVPLRRAAAALHDPDLWAALEAIAAVAMEARANLQLTIGAAAASPWLALPFRLLGCERAAQERWGLRRVAIQPLADGRCAVVAHSSAALARQWLEPTGPSWSDEELMDRLAAGLADALAPWLGEPLAAAGGRPGVLDRRLMRWGAAFPEPPGLPAESMVCPGSRVGFCGDLIAGAGCGRIEGALRSAQALANRLLALLLIVWLLTGPAAGFPLPAAAAEGMAYLCDGDPLLAFEANGPVDAAGIPNTAAGTVPGATVVLEWRGQRLQLPRTNNAGPPSYSDGVWWWSLEDPAQPRFLRRRGRIESFSCRAVPGAGRPADGR
ncbi:MAG: hypothetical protein ER33_13210 [Cyanobium sp. CACIAM 14]|nr:MAG: hypothetical protein ER33_13210 [Cyanobium sp. CACIAM 14]